MDSGAGEFYDRSRAVDDDEDDDESGAERAPPIIPCLLRLSPDVEREIQQKDDHRLPCNTLIVAIGHTATVFLQTHIIDPSESLERIGAVFSGSSLAHNETYHFVPEALLDKTCYLYRGKGQLSSTFVCMCKTDVSPEQTHSWSKQVMSLFDLSNGYVAILATLPQACYYGDSSDAGIPLLRALKTSKFAGSAACPYLEQPSLVMGLPAQLLSHLEVHGLRGILYLCYTQSLQPTETCVRAFASICSSTPFKDIPQSVKSPDVVKNLLDISRSDNMLYL